MIYLNRRKIRAFILNVFQGNLSDLKKTCDLIENPQSGLRLMHASMTAGNNAAHMEALRHFHNFLAAAKSLVDHTRFFVDEHYEHTALKQAYEQRINSDLSRDPLIKFVQDLRNYMLHRDLPASSVSISVSNISFSIAQNLTTTVTIDKEKMLRWSGWTKLSKDYLANAEDKIPISSISAPYGDKILAFYRWFDLKLEKHHQADIEEFNRLQKQYSLAEELEKEQRGDASLKKLLPSD